MEYVIGYVSDEEVEILMKNNIDWYPYDILSKNVAFDNKSECKKALQLLHRCKQKGIYA